MLKEYNNFLFYDPVEFLNHYLSEKGVDNIIKRIIKINTRNTQDFNKNYYEFIKKLFKILVGGIKTEELNLSYFVTNSNKNFINFIDKQFKKIDLYLENNKIENNKIENNKNTQLIV